MIEPEQVRAARALLGWSQANLADRSDINRRTLMNFENGTALPMEATLRRIEEVLNLAGVQMIRNHDGGIGVFLSYESLLEGRLKQSAENVERE